MANNRMYLVCKRCLKGNVYDDPASLPLAKRMAYGYYPANRYYQAIPDMAVDFYRFLEEHEGCGDSFEIAYEMDQNFDHPPKHDRVQVGTA